MILDLSVNAYIIDASVNNHHDTMLIAVLLSISIGCSVAALLLAIRCESNIKRLAQVREEMDHV